MFDQNVTHSRRRKFQRDRLVLDGRTAFKMQAAGCTINDMLTIIGGSRGRLYRAMRAANIKDYNMDTSCRIEMPSHLDPLLL